jgi:hypothetical protein
MTKNSLLVIAMPLVILYTSACGAFPQLRHDTPPVNVVDADTTSSCKTADGTMAAGCHEECADGNGGYSPEACVGRTAEELRFQRKCVCPGTYYQAKCDASGCH